MRTSTRRLALVCSLLALVTPSPTSPAAPPQPPPQTDHETGAPRGQRSPFDEIRYNDAGRAVVRIGDRWYLLESLAGDDWTITWADLRAASERAFHRRWAGRIAMDLDAVLHAAGRAAGDTLTVEARALDGPDDADPAPQLTTLRNLPHTRDKREAVVFLYRKWEEAAPIRDLHKPVDPRPTLEGVVHAIRDLHAQGMRRGIDWDAALAAELARLGGAAPTRSVIHAAQRLVALAGDGHAKVAQFDQTVGAPDLPLHLLWLRGQWRGYGELPASGPEHSRSAGWIWPDTARDVRIDGVPVADWIAAASPYVAAGSEHLVRRRSARLARHTAFIRSLLGIDKPPADPVEITWTTPDGELTSVRLDLTSQVPRPRSPESVPVNPRTHIGSRVLPRPGGGTIALVRIASMGKGDDFHADLHAAMRSALDADALIIDVRGNPGGARDALLIVLPYLMPANALVFNVARPRLRICGADHPDADMDNLLADRFLRPAAWTGWLPAERAAVDALLPGFTPEWSPPEGWEAAGFGPWYVGIVSRERHGPRDKAILQHLPFRGPVAVLLDDRCFSATDIFLGAIELLPNVTLVGTPSGGGSARTESIEAGGLTLVLASIASFRPDGRAYDGAGIEPDILAEPAPEDYQGKGDAVLDAALRHLDQSLTPR